jgi:hypothetical protein
MLELLVGLDFGLVLQVLSKWFELLFKDGYLLLKCFILIDNMLSLYFNYFILITII